MTRIGPLFFWGATAAWLWAAEVIHGATFNVPWPASLSLTSAPSGPQITYRGATNFQFLIQASGDCVNWSQLASNLATSPAMTIVDAQATNQPARFYKGVSLKTPFLYQGTFSIAQRGAFILLVRTNNLATFVGINTTTTSYRGEYATGLAVDTNGNYCGTFITGAPGCFLLTPTNTISGRFTNAAHVAGTLTGVQKANSGIFNGSAGLYSGSIAGAYPGTAKILLCPDGAFAFYRSSSATPPIDGQVSSMRNDGIVDFYTQSGGIYPHVQGQFARTSRTFSLLIHEFDAQVSTATLTLSEPLF